MQEIKKDKMTMVRQRYQLIPSGDQGQRILESDWTTDTPSHTQEWQSQTLPSLEKNKVVDWFFPGTILQPDWTRDTTDYFQPKFVV